MRENVSASQNFMNKPVLLILAASTYQLDVITAAKRMGYYVITTDNIPSNPGHRLADKSYSIDITDKDAVLAIARREQIDGVIAACTDVGVPTAAFVSHHCNLVGPPWPESQILTNKSLFRRFLCEAGFLIPEYFEVTKNVPVSEHIFKDNKWIIKPDYSSGCKGIFIIDSFADFEEYLPDCLAFSPNGIAVMEQFFDGHQGTCEGIVRNGQISNSIVTDRQTVDPPFVVTSGHCIPSRIKDIFLQDLLAQLNRIFSLLRVNNCLFDCDFVIHNDRVYLLEVAPRLGGNSLSKLLQQALHFDIVEYGIRLACGNAPENVSFPKPAPTAILILGSSSSGRLRYNEEGYVWAKKQAWVKHLTFDYPPGSQVPPFINGRNRIGESLISAPSREKLDNRAQLLQDCLNISTQQLADVV